MGRHLSDEQKQVFVEEVKAGSTFSDVARRHGVSYQSVQGFCRRVGQRSPQSFKRLSISPLSLLVQRMNELQNQPFNEVTASKVVLVFRDFSNRGWGRYKSVFSEKVPDEHVFLFVKAHLFALNYKDVSDELVEAVKQRFLGLTGERALYQNLIEGCYLFELKKRSLPFRFLSRRRFDNFKRIRNVSEVLPITTTKTYLLAMCEQLGFDKDGEMRVLEVLEDLEKRGVHKGKNPKVTCATAIYLLGQRNWRFKRFQKQICAVAGCTEPSIRLHLRAYRKLGGEIT